MGSLREEAKRNFMQVTQTDELLAEAILDSAEWVLEDALQLFFNDEEPAGLPGSSHNSSHSSNIDLSGLELSLLTWNIDGLDGNNLATRTKAVGKIVTMLNPDFVFLQEVTAKNKEILDNLDTNYNIHYSDTGSLYFTAILTSKMFDVVSQEVIHFRNSGMGRTLQIVQGKIGELRVFLLTTHLESMAEHSSKRKVQFVQCMEKLDQIIKSHPNAVIVFGGDLNLRDNEVSNVPRGVADAWIAAGSKASEKFTWDTRLNNNKQAFGARCRFDRVFWYGPLKSVEFSLQGKQRIRSSLCFPSDHWAVQCIFK